MSLRHFQIKLCLTITLVVLLGACQATVDSHPIPEQGSCNNKLIAPAQYYILSIDIIDEEHSVSRYLVYDLKNPGIHEKFADINLSIFMDRLSNTIFNLDLIMSDEAYETNSNIILPLSKTGVMDVRENQILISINEVPLYLPQYLDRDLSKGLVGDYFEGNYQVAANLLAVQCPVYEQAIGRVSNVYYYCDFMLADSLFRMSKFEASFVQFENLYYTIPEIAPTANIKRAMILSKLAKIATNLKGEGAAMPYKTMGQKYLADSSASEEISGVLSDFFGSKAALEASFQ